MKKVKEFPFESVRRVTSQEVRLFRKGIEKKLEVKRPSRGRPRKTADKYHPIAIRLHPKVFQWVKRQAKKRGIGYQTIINEVLLKMAA